MIIYKSRQKKIKYKKESDREAVCIELIIKQITIHRTRHYVRRGYCLRVYYLSSAHQSITSLLTIWK